MNYQQTIDYLYTHLPMFTRVGSSAYKANLDNTIALCELLDNPQHKFKSIHIGGTNGKGSTSHMLAAVLQMAGYKTGLYTSPHLKDFRERIRIDGEMISEQRVIDFVEQYQPDFEAIKPSFFEMSVALAFDTFAKEEVDIAIIEVGLGGRLDSTNVISPLFSIITNIGWDHMNILGDTLQLIAAEKAGIIKKNTPIIIGEYQSEVADVFKQKAEIENAPISFASDEWEVEIESGIDKNYVDSLSLVVFPQTSTRPVQHIQLDLTGTYQLKNIKTVLSAVTKLRQNRFLVTDVHVQMALKQVKPLTGLRGRWDIIGHEPLTVCDTGHNPEGIREVLKNISMVKYERLHMVIGMVNDKDISKILYMMPTKAIYYFCKPDIPRGLDADDLKEQGASHRLYGSSYPSVKDALEAARENAYASDLIFVGGSTFVVAEVI